MGPGREAATVRQLVLVVVLVGAAFLGGAFVNGPGLHWARTQLLGSLGLDEGGEIAKVDLQGGPGPDGAGEKTGPGQAAGGAVAAVPGVGEDAGASKPAAADRRPVRRGSSDGEEAPRSPGSAPSPASSSSDRPALMAPAALPSRPDADDPRRPGARPAGGLTGPARAPRDPD